MTAEEMFKKLGFIPSNLINKSNIKRYIMKGSYNFVAFYENKDGTKKIDYKIGARYNKKQFFREAINQQIKELGWEE